MTDSDRLANPNKEVLCVATVREIPEPPDGIK